MFLDAKHGGIIWRAQFLAALKEASNDKPIGLKGTVLNNNSTDAEFEAYFAPLMKAESKWAIEYNVAQLINKEEYLPRFFKMVSKMKSRLKDFKLEKMKRLMNLSNYKDFLMQNVDE